MELTLNMIKSNIFYITKILTNMLENNMEKYQKEISKKILKNNSKTGGFRLGNWV